MKYRIRELRKALGWTGQDLADRVGTTKGYISELETGKRDGGIPFLLRRPGQLSTGESRAGKNIRFPRTFLLR